MEETLVSQGEALRVYLRIYLYLSNKWKPCHGATNSWLPNLRKELEKYCQFH